MGKIVRRFNHLFVVVSIISLFSGCAKYKPHMFSHPMGSECSRSGVSIVASKLSEADCRYYFSRRILSKGFQPIQLLIKNNTDQTYIMDAVEMSINIEDNLYVARRLHLDPIKRFISWAIPGLFSGVFFVPALVDPWCSIDANDKLNDDFRSRTFGPLSLITITPHSSVNRVFFTRACDSVSSFRVILLDKHNDRELVFDVDLN